MDHQHQKEQPNGFTISTCVLANKDRESCFAPLVNYRYKRFFVGSGGVRDLVVVA